MNFSEDFVRANFATSKTREAPVWKRVPDVEFQHGVPAKVSMMEYVSNARGLPVKITKNNAPLPQGVTFVDGVFFYDGVGTGTTTGHMLIADNLRTKP